MDIYEILDSYQDTHEGFAEEKIIEAEKRIGAKLPENYREYIKKYGLDKINTAFNSLLIPEEIDTTYHVIEIDLKEEWQEEFEEVVQNGEEDEYEDHGYFKLWQLPMEEWQKVTENYVLLWTENQGIWYAGYLLSDLQAGNTNPPVYISTEDDLITFKKCTDTMEEFLEIMFEQAKDDMD